MLGPTERGFNHLNSQGPDSGTEMSHCHQSTSMASVEIYLVTGEVQVSFLRIPIKDVKRLSVRPFKWLRFVMYAICGTPGKISATPDGDEVEYDRTELANVDIQYYYQGKVLFLYVDFLLTAIAASQENPSFVDFQGLNDQVTPSNIRTERMRNFRVQIVERDGSCVITGELAEICDAAHLIPRAKGDKVISSVVWIF